MEIRVVEQPVEFLVVLVLRMKEFASHLHIIMATLSKKDET